MNIREWLLSIIGITTVIAVCFIFFKNTNAPINTSKTTSAINITNEESARTALNEVGQFLTKSYEIVDCIDEELNFLSTTPENAATTIEKAKEAIKYFRWRLESFEIDKDTPA